MMQIAGKIYIGTLFLRFQHLNCSGSIGQFHPNLTGEKAPSMY